MKEFSKKLVGSEEERAVSPVIGVILMVAITVILAAVIAAFVLDIGPGDTDPSATFDLNDGSGDDDVEVTLHSLGSGTDGIIVVKYDDDESIDEASVDDEDALTVSGETEGYELDDDEHALIAYSGNIDDAENVEDLNNIAIIDNLEDYE